MYNCDSDTSRCGLMRRFLLLSYNILGYIVVICNSKLVFGKLEASAWQAGVWYVFGKLVFGWCLASWCLVSSVTRHYNVYWVVK